MVIPAYKLPVTRSTVTYRGGVLGIIPYQAPQPPRKLTAKELLAKRQFLIERSHKLRAKTVDKGDALYASGVFEQIEKELADVEQQLRTAK